MQVQAQQLQVGDTVVNMGHTGRHSSPTLRVVGVDGCGFGAQVRVVLDLVGRDGFGRLVEVTERVAPDAPVFVIGR